MWIDIAFFCVLGLAVIKGIRKGLIMSLFSLLAYMIGLIVATKFSAVIVVKVAPQIKWIPFLSFLLVFVLVAWIVRLGGQFIKKIISVVIPGWIDQIAGGLLFVIIYASIFSFFIFFAVQLNWLEENTIEKSVLFPYLNPLAPRIIDYGSGLLPMIKNTFEELRQYYDGTPS